MKNNLEHRGLSFSRAQKAKTPNKKHIKAAIEEANNKLKNTLGRSIMPDIYTR